ncbi:hypothetical protein F4678DRAFT_335705 [Xylaria arbuscula]|nr:hypothetical protein F4678DRAFT_335705 [Xylaria arbuscula]
MASISARFQHEQPDLEVVPAETGLYTLPAPAPHFATTGESFPKERSGGFGFGRDQQNLESQATNNSKQRILGLSVPVFWVLIVTLIVVLAAGIGGGVGGGLSAQQKSAASADASRGDDSNPSDSQSTASSAISSTASSTASSPTASSTTDSLIPTDGCPGINKVGYTPYSADGKPIPVQADQSPQEFKEQCWTNWANTASTHDILRTYTPTLENCITVCAEYNKAYASNLANNIDVGGGPCVAVTIVKEHAGFCYLKNGTGTNDTMGSPGSYSSAILVTSDDS